MPQQPVLNQSPSSPVRHLACRYESRHLHRWHASTWLNQPRRSSFPGTFKALCWRSADPEARSIVCVHCKRLLCCFVNLIWWYSNNYFMEYNPMTCFFPLPKKRISSPYWRLKKCITSVSCFFDILTSKYTMAIRHNKSIKFSYKKTFNFTFLGALLNDFYKPT